MAQGASIAHVSTRRVSTMKHLPLGVASIVISVASTCSLTSGHWQDWMLNQEQYNLQKAGLMVAVSHLPAAKLEKAERLLNCFTTSLDELMIHQTKKVQHGDRCKLCLHGAQLRNERHLCGVLLRIWAAAPKDKEDEKWREIVRIYSHNIWAWDLPPSRLNILRGKSAVAPQSKR